MDKWDDTTYCLRDELVVQWLSDKANGEILFRISPKSYWLLESYLEDGSVRIWGKEDQLQDLKDALAEEIEYYKGLCLNYTNCDQESNMSYHIEGNMDGASQCIEDLEKEITALEATLSQAEPPQLQAEYHPDENVWMPVDNTDGDAPRWASEDAMPKEEQSEDDRQLEKELDAFQANCPVDTDFEEHLEEDHAHLMENTMIPTDLQLEFVKRCLATNLERTGETGESPEYTTHLIEVCSEAIRDDFQHWASFECEEDHHCKGIDIDYLEDHEVENLYLGFGIAYEEFLDKYCSSLIPKEKTMTEQELFDAQNKLIADLDAGAIEHTPEIQAEFDRLQDLIDAL